MKLETSMDQDVIVSHALALWNNPLIAEIKKGTHAWQNNESNTLFSPAGPDTMP